MTVVPSTGMLEHFQDLPGSLVEPSCQHGGQVLQKFVLSTIPDTLQQWCWWCKYDNGTSGSDHNDANIDKATVVLIVKLLFVGVPQLMHTECSLAFADLLLCLMVLMNLVVCSRSSFGDHCTCTKQKGGTSSRETIAPAKRRRWNPLKENPAHEKKEEEEWNLFKGNQCTCNQKSEEPSSRETSTHTNPPPPQKQQHTQWKDDKNHWPWWSSQIHRTLL